MKREPIIKIKDIHGGYGKRKVLFGVNMDIKKGEILLLMGPNGSGKSTLIKIIMGLLRPDKGKIFYNGEDITNLPTEERVERGIGYLRQTRNIFPALTVRENLEIGGYGLRKNKLRERIERVVNYFPLLKDKMDIRAGLLSGGERQALAIGMVLMKDKKILLFDEPTAGLAPSVAKKILESIEKIKDSEDVTFLIVEHNIKLLKEFINRVYLMRKGEVVDEIGREKIDLKIIEKFFLGLI